MNILTQKLGKAVLGKNKLQELFENSKNEYHSIGKIDTKEENLKNIEHAKNSLQKQDEYLQSIRENIKQTGEAIQQGISQEKMREIEKRERENDSQRAAMDREVKEYVNTLKTEKRKKKTESIQLGVDVQRSEASLKTTEDQFKELETQYKMTLSQKDLKFSEESKVKEDRIQNLLVQLNDLRNQMKDEKRKQEDMEDQMDGLEVERQKLVAELSRLDEALGEEGEKDDKDLLLERLRENAKDLKQQLEQLDKQNGALDKEIEEIGDQNKTDQRELDDLKKLFADLNAEDFDLEDLQRKLAEMLDREKKLFDANLKLVTQLKEIDSNDSNFNKRSSELEAMVNLLVDQNYLERKSRVLEKLLRELEDRLRDKLSKANELQRKQQRLDDLIRNPEEAKTFGVTAFAQKLESLIEDINKIRKEKDQVRAKKIKVEEGVVNKDIKEVNEEMLSKCLMGLREQELEVDGVIQKENDVLVVDRLAKNFSDIEKEVSIHYYKKCDQLKEQQEVRQHQITKKLDKILEKAQHIEENVLTEVAMIADDEDEIEILKSKKEILKDVKRTANDIVTIYIEETLGIQLRRIVLKKEETYELIEYFKELGDIEQEVTGIDKEVSQLEKRLYDFEHNLKQFEVELKADFYDDSVKEVTEQAQKIAVLDKQLRQLDEGILQIQQAIEQAQSRTTHSANQQQISELQASLDQLKNLQAQAVVNKRELERNGKILKSDLDHVNLESITPSALGKFNEEIVKQKEQMEEQEKVVADALEQMKKLKDNAEHIAFKRKADKRQDCKLKLKKYCDDLDNLDRQLREINSILEMLNKDTSFLKVNEGSPIKGRGPITTLGDLEKQQDVAKQFKDLEKQQQIYDNIKGERDSLRKTYEKHQKKFDSMTLENASLVDFENLFLLMETDLGDTITMLTAKAQKQLDEDLRVLREQIEFIIEKYKQKRALFLDCRKEEKEKEREVQKAESQLTSLKMRVNQMDRELMNQQSMNFKTNSEKKQLSDSLITTVTSLKQNVNKWVNEIEDQKSYLNKVVVDLNLIGEKVVTLDKLKAIYKQLIEMVKLQGFKDNIKELIDELTLKEQSVEQFIKDLLGGSQYECERKLKEAEALLEKLTKKMMELNNGMNDFEMEIKKGIQQSPDDADILKEGKKLSDENTNDRKALKDIEDQKNLIKKTLLKIKGNMQADNKLDAAALETLIEEIEDCVKKTEQYLDEEQKLEDKLQKRIEEWNKQLLKSGTKDAIVEDIDRALKDNITSLADLDQKLKDMDKMLRGFEEVTKAMKNNPDYELRQSSVNKLIEQTTETRKQVNEMDKSKKVIQAQVDKQKQSKEKGLKKLSIEELQNLTKQCEDTGEELAKFNKESDSMLKELQKRRQKLADADIFDNFKLRVEELNEIDNKNKAIEKDIAVLEMIIVEANKITPKNASSTLNELKQLKNDMSKSVADKEQMAKRLNDLKEKIKAKNLAIDDPYTFTPLINEIKDLRQLLAKKEEDLNKMGQHIKFLKNKYGGVDVEKKFDEFKVTAENQKNRLASLQEDLEVLKELNEEFDGYTSDSQEEDFIERLGIDLRELSSKHKVATEEGELIFEKITVAQKNIQRRKEKGGNTELSAKEIEERATMVAEIEEEASRNQKLVDEIDNKVNKNKKVFMGMQTKQKIKRRQQEVAELNKKLETFENQVNEVEADMQAEFNKIKLGDEKGEKLHAILAELLQEIEKVKQDYSQAGQDLMQIDQDVEDLNTSKSHQFELLKGNIRVKKQILKCLDDAKQIRQLYMQLKSKYAVNKPVKPTYKPTKGDDVDNLLGNWINQHGIPVPIKRISNGYYMFGTKKIYAKIINGNLVIRVGGGYMGIEEFMFYYGAQELNKMLAYQGTGDDEEEEIDLDEAVKSGNKSDLIKHNKDGKSIIGIAQMKNRLSPRAISPRTTSPNANKARGSPRAGSPRLGTQATGRRSPAANTSFLKQATQK